MAAERKVALVTGPATGLGRAIAAKLSSADWLVDRSSRRRDVDDLISRRGRLDLLVNDTAGAALGVRALDRMSHAALPHLRATRGAIVNVGGAAPWDLAQLACNGAAQAMTRGMARRWAALGVRVNLVVPGFVRGEGAPIAVQLEEVVVAVQALQPLQRGGLPEDIANAVVFLASDAAAFITGATLHIDGGLALSGS